MVKLGCELRSAGNGAWVSPPPQPEPAPPEPEPGLPPEEPPFPPLPKPGEPIPRRVHDAEGGSMHWFGRGIRRQRQLSVQLLCRICQGWANPHTALSHSEAIRCSQVRVADFSPELPKYYALRIRIASAVQDLL